MTHPKFRPCPKCQTPNQANRKTCFVCHQSLPTKKNLKEKVQIFDDQWREAVLKNRNVSRVIDSAQIAVRKLHALGFKPILFFAKEESSSSKWVADIITHLETTDTTKNFLDKMQRAYEFLLSVGTPVPVQPQTSTEDAFTHKEQLTGKNAEDFINEPKETTAEEQPKISPQSQEETVIVLDLVPVPPPPPTVPSSPAFQTKRARSPSPAASPIDQPDQESYESPAANAISSSQGGLCDTDSKKKSVSFVFLSPVTIAFTSIDFLTPGGSY
ncbi:uncharacterized protein LOC106960484 isoform X2 [Poecilia latipinna]|uniref:uncharacterized protein LOC106960484 isoform X2 n=1 Tax=Poecilia latipinna TaxID=48699 RepID=UPI00072DAB95|nr:PREDICTED: uncharacterized protein LOC106960484 isoform X2 [Poecilia latipinna]